jgi:hypothetical protein
MNASEEITAARDDLKRAHKRLQRLTEQLPAGLEDLSRGVSSAAAPRSPLDRAAASSGLRKGEDRRIVSANNSLSRVWIVDRKGSKL